MKTEPIAPQLPFVWPAPSFSTEAADTISALPTKLPFEHAVRSAVVVFGVVSAIDSRAINWIEGFLADQNAARLRVVVSIHPTCRTSESDLHELLRLMARHGDRAQFRLYPEPSLEDRSSNLLCFLSANGQPAISTGPTENLGFAPSSASHANVAMQVGAGTFEACRKWFDHLWDFAAQIQPQIVASMPRLVLPKGNRKAADHWEGFREQCREQVEDQQCRHRFEPDPKTGKSVIVDEFNKRVVSPTEAIGVPMLDPLSEVVARVFDQGALVAIDKQSRIPPLEAPVKPEWFGVDSFRQTGMVRAQTSIKVTPFDESMHRKIDRLRRVSGELLPRFSFALADGVRWIPRRAIPLFEAALTAANADAKQILGETVGRDVEYFLVSQRDRIRADAQRMYEGYHPGGKIPESAVDNIIDELKSRLDKTKADKIIPRVAYSPVAFNPSQSSEWSSPWGQAFVLLKGIAEFPRLAITDRFFWQGIKTQEDALITAMDVAGDHIVKEYWGRQAKGQAEMELELIKRLEDLSGDAQAKCSALWALMTSGNADEVDRLIRADGLRRQ